MERGKDSKGIKVNCSQAAWLPIRCLDRVRFAPVAGGQNQQRVRRAEGRINL